MFRRFRALRAPALAGAVLWAALGAPAAAQFDPDCPSPGEAPTARPALSLIWENDAIVGPDRDYTNGIGLVFSSPTRSCAPLQNYAAALDDVFNRLFFPAILGKADRSGYRSETQLAFGLSHQIYTPEDLTRANPDPNDRPYAGWLYYSAAYLRELRAEPLGEAGPTVRSLSITRIDIGVVGPSAQGEAVQRGFHEWIDADIDPQGWDYQIKDEPGLVLRHERRFTSLWELGLIDFEMEWSIGAALGNVATEVSAGLGARIGFNLGADYGPPRLRPGLSGSNHFRQGGDGPLSLYVFGAAGGRLVARNIFIDGNTFRESRSVDRQALVGDYQYGFAVIYRGVKVAATRVHRTDEFVGQSRDSVFDSLGVSVRF